MDELAVHTDITDELLDRLEVEMLKEPQVICPLNHVFTPGLYTRTIFMPKGTRILSETHLTEHQFMILYGACKVWLNNEDEPTLFEAPYHGITKAGTRRRLEIVEDCLWITMHPNPDNLETVEEIAQKILKPNPNRMLNLNRMEELS